tara:strand:- start:2430 stop:2615 length:186 start_codon:yes stop_codon:yes gene_type:complete
MNINKIYKINNTNLYDFSKLNQSKRYIKVESLFCSSPRKAINQAKKILNDKKAKIEVINID